MNFDYASAMGKQIGIIKGELNEAVKVALSKADPEDYEAIKKILGLFIGKLDMELLWPIHRAYPELDRTGIPVPPASLFEPLAESHEGRTTPKAAMAAVPEGYASHIIETCHAAGDLITTLLASAPATAQPDLRKRIGEILATIADQLIHPAIHQHPAINPYKPQP